MKIRNTLLDKVETLKPSKEGRINMYSCGPTVYDYAHIGNLRSFVFADVLYRTLKYEGNSVRWVMNITDVDDKTIRKTIEEFGATAGIKELESFTSKYFENFKRDLQELNIRTEDIEFVKVSDKIPEIILFIKKLLKKGYAYKTEDGVYFDVNKYQKDFKNYGQLVGKGFLKGKKIGARVNVDEYDKNDLSDFALWKKKSFEDGNIFWSDPDLGEGRPGWHIECSTINYIAFKGKPTDIHTGGVDLIFPHHTNEIAQSLPIYSPFVKYWAHCEHLLVSGRKMSKSEGNIFKLEDLKTRGVNPLAYRYLLLGANYGTKLNFTWDSLGSAWHTLRNIETNYAVAEGTAEVNNKKLSSMALKLKKDFGSALSKDLNTSAGLGILHEIAGADILASEKKRLFDEFDSVLGIMDRSQGAKVPEEVQKMADDRELYRRNKQFTQADRLRDEIDRLGYTIKDTPNGPLVQPK